MNKYSQLPLTPKLLSDLSHKTKYMMYREQCIVKTTRIMYNKQNLDYRKMSSWGHQQLRKISPLWPIYFYDYCTTIYAVKIEVTLCWWGSPMRCTLFTWFTLVKLVTHIFAFREHFLNKPLGNICYCFVSCGIISYPEPPWGRRHINLMRE